MKKKLCMILAVMLVVAGLTGCNEKKDEGNSNPESISSDGQQISETTAKEPEVDYNTVYNAKLEEFYYMIKYANYQSEVKEGFTGVVEAGQALEDEALNEIGYLIKDINGDGIKELLIGISNSGDDVYSQNDLYALYTLSGDYPSLVLEGRSRNWYSIIEGDKIFNYGSNGAAFRIFGEYSLTTDGKLECSDFYFSYDKDGSYTNIGFFHNTTGVYDMAEAQELNISEEEFRGKEEAFAKRAVKLDFTPFSSFVPSGDGAEYFNGAEAGEPLFLTINGDWSTVVEADGEDYVLKVGIYSDGSAIFKIGFLESEFVVDYRGTWSPAEGGTAISLDMDDEYGSGPFKGVFSWNMNNDFLTLMHKSGDPLLYGMEGKSITFNEE